MKLTDSVCSHTLNFINNLYFVLALADKDLLNEVIVPIIDTNVCRNLPGYEHVTYQMMCAGYLTGNQDACTGDSGGPLFYKFKSGQYAQVGIVSHGIQCAGLNQPGVYTRLASYIKWIADNIQ